MLRGGTSPDITKDAGEKVTFARWSTRATVTGFLEQMQAQEIVDRPRPANQRRESILSFYHYAAAAEPALAIILADLAAIPRHQRNGDGTGEVHDHAKRGHGAARSPRDSRAPRTGMRDQFS